MVKKTYLVQTWDKEGVKNNHYEVVVEGDAALGQLRKFLQSKYGHVVISHVPDKQLPPKRRRK
jgi:hypothetical protein